MTPSRTMSKAILAAAVLLTVATALAGYGMAQAQSGLPHTTGIQFISDPGPDGIYILGETILLELTFDRPVRVKGNPQIMFRPANWTRGLNFKEQPAPNRLIFQYRVYWGDHPKQASAFLGTGQFINHGGTVEDNNGNVAVLTDSRAVDGLLTFPFYAEGRINRPSVWEVYDYSAGAWKNGISITSEPGSDGVYGAGDVITARVVFNGDVKVTGNPQLKIEVGSNERTAKYVAQANSRPGVLHFSYIVQAGETDNDGVKINANRLTLPEGATIKGTASDKDANIAHNAYGPFPGHKVDATATRIVALSFSVAGPHRAGDKITALAQFSGPVTVNGNMAQLGRPSLPVQVGEATRTAVMTGDGNASSSHRFEYVVQDGEHDADGASVPAGRIALPAGIEMVDGANDPALLTHDGIDADPKHTVDAKPPTVTGVSLGTARVYKMRDQVTVSVVFSEAVNVSGNPQAAIEIGDAKRQATYAAGSGTSTLEFNCPVAKGEIDNDGITAPANGLTLNGGSIEDYAGNPADLSYESKDNDGHLVDAVPPTIQSVSAASAGPYKLDDSIRVAVEFDKAVAFQGEGYATLTVTVGTTERKAQRSLDGAAAQRHAFTYAVQSGDLDTDGWSVAAGSIELPETATATGPSGNSAELSHDGVSAGAAHLVDADRPTAPAGLKATPGDGKAVLSWEPTTDQTVTGHEYRQQAQGEDWTPWHDTDAGNRHTVSNLENGAKYAFEVRAVDGIGHGTSAGPVYAVPEATHRVSAGPEVTSSPQDGNAYRIGEHVDIKLTFSRAVAVNSAGANPPTFGLTVGTARRAAAYHAGSGAREITFRYTVQAGDRDTDGISAPSNSVQLNGGSIVADDDASVKAKLEHPALAAQTIHQVDGRAAVSVTTTRQGGRIEFQARLDHALPQEVKIEVLIPTDCQCSWRGSVLTIVDPAMPAGTGLTMKRGDSEVRIAPPATAKDSEEGATNYRVSENRSLTIAAGQKKSTGAVHITLLRPAGGNAADWQMTIIAKVQVKQGGDLLRGSPPPISIAVQTP